MQNDTCYILALIKRDDGERLLLGSGFYQFNKEQKHFNPNVFANDIVELQGADGQLLAGQVRRSSAQSFDGYIGDGTTSKQTVEQKRREFFLFFRKQHHYTVVYIMPDGTAIKRDRGYIVDAPAVQELYQVQPKWHIALAFEDVNYYSYAEDAQGNEIYSFTQMLGLANVVDGGLIWDNAGAVSSPTGLANIRINGDTFQQTYTGKNLVGATEQDYENGGIKTTINSDGTITCKGTCTQTYFQITRQTAGGGVAAATPCNIPAGTYTLSLTNTTSQFGVTLRLYASTTATDYKQVIVTKGNSGNTITLTSPAVMFYIWGSSTTVGQAVDETIGIQFEAGSTPSQFEPYVGGAPSPSPEFPQQIQKVTGEQTVTIGGTSYTVDLGATELCKLDIYQDYIWKDGDDWKVHKETAHETRNVDVNGISGANSGQTTVSATGAFAILSWTPYWFNYANQLGRARVSENLGKYVAQSSVTSNATAESMEDGTFCQRAGTNDRVYFRNTALIGKSGNEVKAIMLAKSGGANAWWTLATPTDTVITDAGLIAQLEAVAEAMAEDGKPSSVTPTGTNLPAIITGDLNGTGGYVWAPSTGGGPVTVTVDGVDSANPVWHVFGACSNPTLTNSTTGQALTWNGDVPAGQELIIDMGAQTATLEGANVFEFVSGSWIQLAPGTNRISYTAANTTKDSKIEWNEIVG